MAEDESEPTSEVTDGPDASSEEGAGEAISFNDFEIFDAPPVTDPNRLSRIPVIGDDGALGDPTESVRIVEAPPESAAEAAEALKASWDAPSSSDADHGVADPGPSAEPSDETVTPRVIRRDQSDVSATIPASDGAPAASDADLTATGEASGATPPTPADGPSLPHWTEPASGQVPEVVAGRPTDDVWAEVTGPRWKGDGPDWESDDLAEVFGDNPVGGSDPDEADPDPNDTQAAGRSGATPAERRPRISIGSIGEPFDDPGDDDVAPTGPITGSTRVARPRPRPPVAPPEDRNLVLATAIGVGLGALALVAFWIDGNVFALALITAVVAVASLELFHALRTQGTQPASLLGVLAAASLPLSVYWLGTSAFVLIIALTVVFGALWYLVGADYHRPALNLGLTMLGVNWVGGLATFAALLLLLPDGKSTIVFTIVVTVASDTGALAGGRAFGRTPFSHYSPNKTWEGTAAGFACAVLAGVVLGILEISVFSDNLVEAALLGAVIGVLAPLGDLTESMVKRDIGVKDMGSLLPGHGGLMDRIDGLLFALPGAYYLTLLLGLDQAPVLSALGW